MSESQIIPIHFNVVDASGKETHHLLWQTFIQTGGSIEKIAQDICEKFFGDEFVVEMVVLPSEEGSFFKKVKVTIIKVAIGGSIVAGGLNQSSQFLATPVGKAAFKRIFNTDKDPEYFIENLGKEESASLMAESTKYFLQTSNDDLVKDGIKNDDFPKAFAGRSSFYRACQENSEIRALEFCRDNKFPIKKADFCNYITNDYIKKLTPERKLHELAIVSPIIKQRKKSKLKWKAEDKISGKILDFSMDDKEFKKRFLAGDYPLKESGEDDVIIGLFEYQKVEINGELKLTSSVSATKIYQFNDQRIETIPTNLVIEKVEILDGSKIKQNKSKGSAINPDQLSLFGEV